MTHTFTRIDSPFFSGLQHDPNPPYSGRFVSSWRSDRGRAYELDKTEAGTASITCFDTTGYFDPTNPASPWYGQITPNMRIALGVINPANGVNHDVFTGFVEGWEWTMDTAEQLMTVTISLNDGFELLTRTEIPPTASGSGYASQDGTTIFDATSDVQTRLDALLDIAGWPVGSDWRKLNTGNCFLQRTVYNVQTSVLSAIQDACDAEFPGVANFFINKTGAATFYGRYPRFKPTQYPDDVQFWQVGDASAADTFGCAQISDIGWSLDSKNLINAALCYPYGIAPGDIEGQLVFDQDSIDQYGVRTLSLPDLINDGQPASANPDSGQQALNSLDGTKIFSSYYVDNYAQPQLRINKLVFKSRPPGDSQTWAFMCGVEIGDIITVFTRNPGGGGFSKQTDGMALSQFFVEGIHNVVNPLTDRYPDWTMTLDVSPRGWFPANYPIGGTP